MNRERLRSRLDPLLELTHPHCPELPGRLLDLAEEYAARIGPRRVPELTHHHICLITYGGSVRRPGEAPLRTLRGLLDRWIGEVVTDVHLLPMFPWTSDDGFAVVDHRQVEPDLGSWADVTALARDRSLMVDFVANHTSAQAPWFDGWLHRDPGLAGFYIEAEEGFDTSRVVRPRTTPLFHPFTRPDGSRVAAWTTFGPDQVDVNVQEPAVLLELTDVLLGYLLRGASAVRLDAIGFLWKATGTRCLHLPETHAVIKAWRAIVDEVLPGGRLITETNVPHQDNISYFGDGTDEATMVYQFALPPLVLHAFVHEDASRLGAWAQTIGRVSDTATWFNFLASHDGIGLRPTEGILDDAERDTLVDRTLAVGGAVSMASLPDGTEAVYELNVSYLDALCTPDELSSADVVAAKAQAAHSILLTMIGVPAIYLHSLLGTGSDREGMAASGSARRINRAVLDADRLEAELLADPRRRSVFQGLHRLLDLRRTLPALSPFGTQRTLDLDPSVLALLRGAGTADELLCLTNVTRRPVRLEEVRGIDVVTGLRCAPLELGPWGFAWVRPD